MPGFKACPSQEGVSPKSKLIYHKKGECREGESLSAGGLGVSPRIA